MVVSRHHVMAHPLCFVGIRILEKLKTFGMISTKTYPSKDKLVPSKDKNFYTALNQE